jgi:iron complex outermembrane receptor protein
MKFILGVNYDIGKFGFNFNNTYFGKTKFAQQGLQNLESIFINPSDIPAGLDLIKNRIYSKIVTDLGINFNATDKLIVKCKYI